MTDQYRPGQPKDQENNAKNPDKNNQNPHDRQNQGGTDKGRQDQNKDRNPNDKK